MIKVYSQASVDHAARALYHKGGFWLMQMSPGERKELVRIVIEALNDPSPKTPLPHTELADYVP